MKHREWTISGWQFGTERDRHDRLRKVDEESNQGQEVIRDLDKELYIF